MEQQGGEKLIFNHPKAVETANRLKAYNLYVEMRRRLETIRRLDRIESLKIKDWVKQEMANINPSKEYMAFLTRNTLDLKAPSKDFGCMKGDFPKD